MPNPLVNVFVQPFRAARLAFASLQLANEHWKPQAVVASLNQQPLGFEFALTTPDVPALFEIPHVTQMLAYIGRFALLLFTVAILVLHVLSPEFDPISQGISYYALGKFGWVFTGSLLLVGLACVAVVVLLWRRCPTKWGRLGLLLLMVWALMLEAGAFFEMDAPGAVPTVSGRIHSVAGTSFLLLPPAALLIARSLSRLHPPGSQCQRGWVLAWCVVIASGLLITFNGFLLGLGVGGLVQRAYWLTTIVWLFSLAQTRSHEAADAHC